MFRAVRKSPYVIFVWVLIFCHLSEVNAQRRKKKNKSSTDTEQIVEKKTVVSTYDVEKIIDMDAEGIKNFMGQQGFELVKQDKSRGYIERLYLRLDLSKVYLLIRNDEEKVFNGLIAREGLRLLWAIELRVTLDKNENFDGQFSPRVSAVYTAGEDREHNFRASCPK